MDEVNKSSGQSYVLRRTFPLAIARSPNVSLGPALDAGEGAEGISGRLKEWECRVTTHPVPHPTLAEGHLDVLAVGGGLGVRGVISSP